MVADCHLKSLFRLGYLHYGRKCSPGTSKPRSTWPQVQAPRDLL